MMNKERISIFTTSALVVVLVGSGMYAMYRLGSDRPLAQNTVKIPENQAQLASANMPQDVRESASSTPAASPAANRPNTPKTTATTSHRASDLATVTKTSSATTVVQRLPNAYPTQPQSFDTINSEARPSIVNIFCISNSSSMTAISGSGVIIDPSGIILTNAHVAQYVLLSEDPRIDISCTIRTGSPAVNTWTANVAYMPESWVAEHAKEINEAHPTGTGQYDYALLRITGTTSSSSAVPATFPYVVPDMRENVAFLNDPIISISYPAEFVGSGAAYGGLYEVSTVSTIKQLLTFASSTLDAYSIGGVIDAQGGSSGGAVLNQWDRLVGLIVTTTAGTTTAQRDLRALSLNYIDQNMTSQTGVGISAFLAKSPAAQQDIFSAMDASRLISYYIPYLNR